MSNAIDARITAVLQSDNPKEVGGAWSVWDISQKLDLSADDVEAALARIAPYKSFVGGTSVYLYWLSPMPAQSATDGSGRTRADIESEGMADARARAKRDAEIIEPSPQTRAIGQSAAEKFASASDEPDAPASARDSDGRPIGACPDCGKPITLQRSGWWTHDGMPGDCWHQSMDGPNDPDTTEPDDHDSPLFLTFKHADGQTISFPIDDVSTDIEILRDGSTRINATGAALRDWASKPRESWPCSELARLRSIHVRQDAKGDLVELGCDPEYVGGERIEPSADELDAWIASALRADVIKTALEIEPECLEGIDGPGKFEGTDSELAAAMHAISMVSGEDDRAGDVESTGAAWRVDRFVAVENSQGFVSAEGYRSVPDAETALRAFDEPDDESGEGGGEDPEPSPCAGSGDHSGQSIDACDECSPEIAASVAAQGGKPIEPVIYFAGTLRAELTRKLANGSLIVAKVEARDDSGTLSPGFSVTGEIYERHGTWSGETQRRNGREPDLGGCIHDEILKAFPQLAPFVALHLSDLDGVPMHAAANARYFIEGALVAEKSPHEFSRYVFDNQYGVAERRGETASQYGYRVARELLRVDSLPADWRDIATIKARTKAIESFCDEQRDRWKSEARKAVARLQEMIAEKS
jgi:hypothetical protein